MILLHLGQIDMPPEIRKSQQSDNILATQKEQDTVFLNRIREAETSGVPTTLAQAKKNYGSWLMFQIERRYVEAVPLFRQVAQIQTLENNRIEAANAYTMLSSCLFLIGDVDSLKEAEDAAKKAVEFYPDSEDFADLKRTQVIKRIAILGNLAHETGDENYFNQGVNLCKQYADTLKGSKELWKKLQEEGLA
jgi:hypothetical protein